MVGRCEHGMNLQALWKGAGFIDKHSNCHVLRKNIVLGNSRRVSKYVKFNTTNISSIVFFLTYLQRINLEIINHLLSVDIISLAPSSPSFFLFLYWSETFKAFVHPWHSLGHLWYIFFLIRHFITVFTRRHHWLLFFHSKIYFNIVFWMKLSLPF